MVSRCGLQIWLRFISRRPVPIPLCVLIRPRRRSSARIILSGSEFDVCGIFSITHRVDEGEPASYIGSDTEYAAYVELGTGKHYPGGRPTPWVYQDAKGNWHWTAGNKAQPYLKPAAANYAAQYRKIVEDEMKNG